MGLLAITRAVSPRIVDCELTHLQRAPIDVVRASAEHAAYVTALTEMGLTVESLPHGDFPDGVFVEDPAIVVDEVGVLTRMGVESRRAESPSLAVALARHRKLVQIEAPATIEGGDVLRIDKTLFVGISGRTNRAGAEALARILAPYGYRIVTTTLGDCLHLKSACSYLGEDKVLVHPDWIDAKLFDGFDLIGIDAREPFAANCVFANGTVLFPAQFPRTHERLLARGCTVHTVENSELMKAESALTCMSQIFRVT